MIFSPVPELPQGYLASQHDSWSFQFQFISTPAFSCWRVLRNCIKQSKTLAPSQLFSLKWTTRWTSSPLRASASAAVRGNRPRHRRRDSMSYGANQDLWLARTKQTLLPANSIGKQKKLDSTCFVYSCCGSGQVGGRQSKQCRGPRWFLVAS